MLHIDFETRSVLDLRVVGADIYAPHDTTGVWCMAYAFDDEPIATIYPESEPLPVRIADHVAAGGKVAAHNVAFEIAIWNHNLNIADEWPHLDPQQCICTMAMCYAMGLPGALEDAAPALGLSARKDAEGRRLMLQMASPRSVDPLVWWDDPAKVRRLVQYCEQDVNVERELTKRLAPLSARERKVWAMDWRINRRGVYVDAASVTKAVALVDAAKVGLDKRMQDLTGGAVEACTRVADIVTWLNDKGIECTSVAKDQVVTLLEDDDLPADVRDVLALRQEAGKSSTAKLKKMLEGLDERGRLCGMFQYHGAATGRWAARRVQLHNMPRPKHEQDVIEAAFNFLDEPEFFDLIGVPVMDMLPSMLRGMLTAAPGKTLVAVDFNAIEARVLAWLAGQDNVLDVFRTGADIYCHQASAIYGRPIDKKRDPDERQIGKVAILALGYQGGVGAFQAMAKAYNVRVSDEKADDIKVKWRDANPAIKAYWNDLENAAKRAITHPGSTQVVGPAGRQVQYRVNGSFLWCRLPSGRLLCYAYPKLVDKEMWWGEVKATIAYKGVDGISRKWCDQYTYGGSLAENITQAVARDCLSEAMLRVDERRLDIVLHVHDELVVEVNEAKGEETLKLLTDECSKSPTWAPDLPITAEGWHGKRYRK